MYQRVFLFSTSPFVVAVAAVARTVIIPKEQSKTGCSVGTVRAGLKGRGARVSFHWRAPMTYFMTSSFVKFFLLIRNVLICFFQ